MRNSELSYCGDVVCQHDPDRFLLSMFVKAEHRAALWALFAFYYEIAKTREVVSETQLGLIRLQWWKDAIGKIYTNGEIVSEKSIQALAEAIKKYDLPYADFEMLIHAREFDLEDVLPGNLEGLLNYADFTITPVMKLAVRITGGDVDAEPVRPIAVNYALAGLLRAVPFHASQRRCYLPEDLMRQNGVSTTQLYEGKSQDGLKEVVEAVFDEFVFGVRADNKFLRVSQRLAEIYAKQLKKLDYNVLNPRLQAPPAFKVLRLLVA